METIEGFTFTSFCDEHTEEFKKNSRAERTSNPEMSVQPSGCVLPEEFKRDFKRIYNFEVYPDDTWIVTYPKSGTTWTQEMVWLLMNKLDYKTAKSVHLRYRCPFLELESIITKGESGSDEVPKTIELSANTPRPRIIKSHLPLEMLPKGLWTVKPKIIYVCRDPRDVAISYYHHYRLWNGYQGTLENFTNAFLADKLVYSPFWSHLLSFWNLEDKSHIHMNNFEEMKRDLPGVIKKTAKFLNVEITDEQVEELKEHLTFKNMKNNNSCNFLDLANEVKNATKTVDDDLVFIRKGESGGWKTTYSKEMTEKFDKWTAEKLAGTAFNEYPYSVK